MQYKKGVCHQVNFLRDTQKYHQLEVEIQTQALSRVKEITKGQGCLEGMDSC